MLSVWAKGAGSHVILFMVHSFSYDSFDCEVWKKLQFAIKRILESKPNLWYFVWNLGCVILNICAKTSKIYKMSCYIFIILSSGRSVLRCLMNLNLTPPLEILGTSLATPQCVILWTPVRGVAGTDRCRHGRVVDRNRLHQRTCSKT